MDHDLIIVGGGAGGLGCAAGGAQWVGADVAHDQRRRAGRRLHRSPAASRPRRLLGGRAVRSLSFRVRRWMRVSRHVVERIAATEIRRGAAQPWRDRTSTGGPDSSRTTPWRSRRERRIRRPSNRDRERRARVPCLRLQGLAGCTGLLTSETLFCATPRIRSRGSRNHRRRPPRLRDGRGVRRDSAPIRGALVRGARPAACPGAGARLRQPIVERWR